MASSPYVIDFAGTYWLAAPPQEVWAAIEQVERFPQWWTWLREFRLEGEGLTDGSVLRGVVCPPLPYRMRLSVLLNECVRPRLVRAEVHGDLEGRAELALEAEGTGTRARAAWSIEMTQPPMRVAARVAHPLLSWGHDRVVDATVTSFRQHVEVVDPR